MQEVAEMTWILLIITALSGVLALAAGVSPEGTSLDAFFAPAALVFVISLPLFFIAVLRKNRKEKEARAEQRHRELMETMRYR